MNKYIFYVKTFFLVFGCAVAQAETPWPIVMEENYPYVQGMKLIRHEETVIFGESSHQTGIFYSSANLVSSSDIQKILIEDAERKGWLLQTTLRYGNYHVTTFAKDQRLLDIRMDKTNDGVDAIYVASLKQ